MMDNWLHTLIKQLLNNVYINFNCDLKQLIGIYVSAKNVCSLL